MITFQEARQKAEDEINKHQTLENDLLIIIDGQTIEKEYAWIFPYTSKRYWETNDINYAIAGNGPIFISKFDGQVSAYRTGLSIEGMIDEHEEENKVWALSLKVNTVIDTKTLITLKQILGWTQMQVTDFKQNKNRPLEYGSKTRLTQIQTLLSSSDIKTNLAIDNRYIQGTNR